MVARSSLPPDDGHREGGGLLPARAGNDSLIVLPVARVVLSCSVNERLRSDWGVDFLRARNENPARQFKGGVSGTRMQKGGQGSNNR